MERTPDNASIAALFEEAAELLILGPRDPHRARAFRRAAQVIRMLPEPVAVLARQGRLEKVRGIGEGTTHRIKQALRTGSWDDLRRLRAELPAGLRELLKLRGVGPSKVRMLHQNLGVRSVEELEAALRGGRLARLPGFKERSLQQLELAIAHYRQQGRRLSLGRALELGERMLAQLRESPAVLEAELGGSLRRRKETIGDIDFIAAAADTRAAVAQFCTLDPLSEVLSRGEAQASARLPSGHQVDIWVFPPAEYGAGLHAFSGSQTHVVGIRERAGHLGLHISEHGLFRRSDRARIAGGAREGDIFAAVGLCYVPPELREACGEIEAAERGRIPELVELRDLRGDLHLHTHASDGSASAWSMAQAAAARGLDYIAVTDHSKSLAVARGLDEARLGEQVAELRALEQRLGACRVLAGCEVDILADGELDLDPRLLRELDWVVASVHSEMDQPAPEMTTRLIRAMQSGVVDCIGHATGRRINLRPAYPLDLERILRAAADLGVAFEINSNPGRLDLDSVAARQARDLGVGLLVNSDAHAPVELDNLRLGICVARRGWLEARHVLNTGPWEGLLERRQARMRRMGLTLGAGPALPRARPESAAVEVSDGPDGTALVTALHRQPIERGLAVRLERYLRAGEGDVELERALASLGQNTLQVAFNLLHARATAEADAGSEGASARTNTEEA